MAGFSNPLVLVLLLLVPAGYFFYRKILDKKQKQSLQFSNIGFVKSAMGDTKKIRRADLLFYITLAIVASMIIAFANPHISLKQTKEGVNVVLVLDVSGSMSANDYSPNRLEAAKASAKTLVSSLEKNDHVGVVIFGTGATTSAYLSPFKESVLEKISGIKLKDGATAIGDGLALGIDMATSIPNKKKVVILLSDGVNNAGVISPDESIEFANNNKIQVYSIGMGSDGQVVLGYDWYGRPQYAELDESTLKKIAINTGGQYFKSINSKTLDEVYKNISDDIKREKEETPIGMWFFILAFILILVEIYYRYGDKRIIQ